MFRLDGLVPNTPRNGSANRANGTSKRKVGNFETPSMSRVKAELASSPPDLKTPYKPGDQNGQSTTYVRDTSILYTED
jgi:DNA polymerase alpha subunit B